MGLIGFMKRHSGDEKRELCSVDRVDIGGDEEGKLYCSFLVYFFFCYTWILQHRRASTKVEDLNGDMCAAVDHNVGFDLWSDDLAQLGEDNEADRGWEDERIWILVLPGQDWGRQLVVGPPDLSGIRGKHLTANR